MPVWEWGGTRVLVHPSPAASQPQPPAKKGCASPVPNLWLSHGRSVGGLSGFIKPGGTEQLIDLEHAMP